MPPVIDDVSKTVIAIKCTSLNDDHSGSGTAFWVKIDGVSRLVTARHVPWNYTSDHPVPVNTEDVFDVAWCMESGETGKGYATIHVNNNGKFCEDFAWIEFAPPESAPPFSDTHFVLSSRRPCKGDEVVGLGFPGGYPPQHPCPQTAWGTVQDVQKHEEGNHIVVAGKSDKGCSGGPVFFAENDDVASLEVMGMIIGAPDDRCKEIYKVNDLFSIEGAKSFRVDNLG